MNTPDTRFVTCPECEGYGACVIGHGHFADGSENNEEVPCPTCEGYGTVEMEIELLTEADIAAKLKAETIADIERLQARARQRQREAP